MTAPIWVASPPEVHAALLSAGPGPGPLLAAAAAWRALGVEYTAAADELTALLAAVQAGTWDGPSAASYTAANLPYLGWLLQSGADSATTAVLAETAAAGYAAALSAMPTLAELAANHAVHAVLTATNFFGVNLIPIALNEADYARMWVQAAVVMSAYQAVAGVAAAAVPAAPAAPQIVKAHAAAANSTSNSTWPPLPPDTEQDIMAWMQSHGYLNFYNNVIQPMVNALANNPYLQSLFNGFDPYLTFTGNPLSFLSPFNVAFALGYPMTFSQYAAFLSETFGFIGADLTAAFASGNPASIAGTLLFTAVEAVGTIITDTIALLKTLLEQAIVLIPVVLPMLTAALAPLAAPAAGLSGLAGLAGLATVPAVPVLPVVPPPVALALTAPPAPAPVPAPAPPPVAAPPAPPPAAAPPAPPPSPPPAITGPEIMAGYLVAGLRQDARRGAAAAAKKKTPKPAAVAEPAPAQPVDEPARARRRRRARAGMLGRGYEYMDLDDDPAATARGCRPLGSAGTAPGGLTALAEDAFGGVATPMVPGTWDGVR